MSLINSYISYKCLCELKGVPQKWTHHDLNEAVGYAHVDLEEYWPRRKSPSPPMNNAGKVPAGNTRSPKFDTHALSLTRDRLRGRLNSEVAHMPVQPEAAVGTTVCQLHRWAWKEFNPDDGKNNKPVGLRSQVMRCQTCLVNLCLPFWEIYHSKERLRSEIPGILGL